MAGTLAATAVEADLGPSFSRISGVIVIRVLYKLREGGMTMAIKSEKKLGKKGLKPNAKQIKGAKNTSLKGAPGPKPAAIDAFLKF